MVVQGHKAAGGCLSGLVSPYLSKRAENRSSTVTFFLGKSPGRFCGKNVTVPGSNWGVTRAEEGTWLCLPSASTEQQGTPASSVASSRPQGSCKIRWIAIAGWVTSAARHELFSAVSPRAGSSLWVVGHQRCQARIAWGFVQVD